MTLTLEDLLLEITHCVGGLCIDIERLLLDGFERQLHCGWLMVSGGRSLVGLERVST